MRYEFISSKVTEPRISVLRNLGDVIWFGKFKDCTVKQVLEKDPSYLKWLITNTDKTYFSKKIQDEINERAEKEDEFFNNPETGFDPDAGFDFEYY